MKLECPELENEHNYLLWLIRDRYFCDSDFCRDPILNKVREALSNGNIEQAKELEKQDGAIGQQLFERRMRSEDILSWLRLDTNLRRDGMTYPEVYER